MNRTLRVSGPILLALLTVTSVAAAQDLSDPPDVSKIVSFVRWSGVFISAFVVAGAVIALRFLGGIVTRLSARFAHRRLLFSKIESFTRFFVYFATGIVVVGLSFQINQTVLTLIGGTFAVAVGFAMRDLVAAMIAGVTIMFDRPFQVGDRVQYAGEYGDITAIGLRSVRMQTLDDNTVTIPNNKILTDVSSCGNYGALDMQVQIDFFVGVDQDIELAERLITEGILSSRYVFLDKPVVVIMKEEIKEDYVALHLRGKAYVLDTKYEKAFETDVTKRVLLAFRKNGVHPPAVLHRTVDTGPRQAEQPSARALPS
ncbi:MAG: mechanosensitive ion channel family protein [Myxococcales bacterium]|nr:mechanosensitive ion channel family protein [Myxococcales bacterium]MCB9575899.1 mechanosensitive ion channel family protein [Polyangiaceae bacterium]